MEAMKVRKLSRYKTSDQSGTTRSESIIGECKWPVVGERFVVLGATKFDGSPGTRVWSTSPVVRVTVLESDESCVITTKSGSEYVLDPA